MEQITKQTIKNASFLLAGGACLLMIAGHFFHSPYGFLPIKGFQFVASLAIPTLCFWVGMLIRWKVGKPKWWVLATAGVAMLASLYLSRHTVNIFNWPEIRFYWYFLILVGFMMPWNYILEKGDKDGILSIALLVITGLTYAAIELTWQRMGTSVMQPKYEDIATLLLVVTANILPLATIPPVFFAAMFSFSKAGQWLGSKKWFQWIAGIAAITCFLGSLPGLRFSFGIYEMPHWIRFFVQPITIYLIVVIRRIIRKLRKKEITWKEVFSI